MATLGVQQHGHDRLEGGGNDVPNGDAGNDALLGGARSDTADFFYGDKIFGGAMVAGAGVMADLAAGTATGDDLVGTARLAPS